MKNKILIAILLLGSSAAMATPAYRPAPVGHSVVRRGTSYQPTNTTLGADASEYKGWVGSSPVRYRGTAKAGRLSQHHERWFDLTEATRIDRGREFFKIGADKGVFKALRLQGLGEGRSNIQQITIEYSDASGAEQFQKVALNTSLGVQNPITIDLAGGYRSINTIVVYGSTDRGSAYKLVAL